MFITALSQAMYGCTGGGVNVCGVRQTKIFALYLRKDVGRTVAVAMM